MIMNAIGRLILVLVAFGATAYSGTGISTLPAAAQARISADLGRGSPAYRVRKRGAGLDMVNAGQKVAARFTARGIVVRAGNASWGMALRAYGYAGAMQAVNQVGPQAGGNRVAYRRGILTEWYFNGPFGLEQGFTLTEPPGRTRHASALTIALALSGDLTAAVDPGGNAMSLIRKGGQPVLRYSGLCATDAAGHELPASVELRGGRLLLTVDDSRARYPIVIDPLVQLAELTASNGQGEDLLGYSVAVSGNTVAVGAPGGDSGQGAAYIFVKPASGWANMTQTAELTASNGAAGDEFGYSVAIDGDTVVAGAYGATIGSDRYDQGAAYVFVEPAGGWTNMTQTARLTASNGAKDDWFGASVSISGNTIAIGAAYAQNDSYDGAVYVFVKPAAGWRTTSNFNAELTPLNGTGFGEFGMSTAIAGDTVVAGAQGATVGSNLYQGAVYIFVKPAGGWAGSLTSVAELTASDGQIGDRLGQAVAVSGDTVIGGAYQNDTARGAAYVFTMPEGGWSNMTQTAKLTASDGAAYDWFGYSVAIAGNTVVVGASDATNFQGKAYIYVKPTSGWETTSQFRAELIAGDGSANDAFGISVSISGRTVAVGSAGWNGGSQQGAAYVF
jgi:hypothetical protein